MKLIHTADLHLGARSTTHLTSDRARQRRRELLTTFGRIAELAVAEGAKAVLIAGDLFDTATPSRETLEYVIGTVRRTPSVRFLCLPGNHDAGELPDLPMPENMTVFGREWGCVSIEDVDIYGIAPEGAVPYGALTPDAERKNIVMLHGEVREGGKNAKGGVYLSHLSGRGVDYLALGHYHSYSYGRIDERGIWAYSGTPAGRGFDEVGECGVLILDTDALSEPPVFCPLGARRIEVLEVPIEGAEDLRAIEAMIEAAVEGIDAGAMVRVKLLGALPPEAPRRDLLHIAEAFAERFFHFEVQDKTRLFIDPKSYEDSLSLKGEFIRRVQSSLLTEEEKDAVIAVGLAALRGEELPE